MNVYIYEVVPKKILGIDYNKHKQLKSYKVPLHDDAYELYRNDYVSLIKYCIEKYESSIEQDLSLKLENEKVKSEFLNWDGKC